MFIYRVKVYSMIYIKIINCPYCNSKIEIRITRSSTHGFIKRFCNVCKKKWRVSKNKAMSLTNC